MEALQYITENHPEMLPEDRLVSMWNDGKQTELMMMGFDITFDPTEAEGLSEEILDKHLEAYDLLLNDEPQAAELLLHEIMAAAPDFPSAYNQLAVAYEMQGQRQKARELVEETHARFPDYFFARVALARMLVAEGQIQEARDLVGPLLRQSQLHITEFRALAQMQMDMALAEKQTEAARSWLEMWRQVEPDNPEVHEWKVRIDGPGLLKGLQNLLGRSRDG
jgi:tetratricopeptide (TPR) repeat protein